MTKKQKAIAVFNNLKEIYEEASCTLDHKTPFELLVSVRLSAQCTDKRVDMVTPVLFKRFPTMQSIADANLDELMEIIRPCGLFFTKSKDIKEISNILIEKFDGNVPDTMEGLLSLPGIGRKSANLIMGEVYGMPGAVVTDTHCIRLANRLGLCSTKNPEKVENELRRILLPEISLLFCHLLVYHGRQVCNARKPRCSDCTVSEYCSYYKKEYKHVG